MDRYANNRLTVALARAILRDQVKAHVQAKPATHIPAKPQHVEVPPPERFIEAKE
jgi:hypothetical protein